MNSLRLAPWLLLSLVLIFSQSATASHAQDDLAAGLKAFEMEDNERARDLLLPLAEAGVPEAQYHLALLYYPHRLPHDRVKHRDWLTRAAEQNYLPAMEALGDDYWACDRSEKDLHKAVEWLEKAADMGSVEAMYRLGFLREYDFEGELGGPDFKAARPWYQKAAEAGDPEHQEKYALTLLDRRFGTPDRTAAVKWLALAAEGGREDAADYLSLIRLSRGQPEDPKAVLDWRPDDCTELPLKSLRIGYECGFGCVDVYTGKGKRVLRLGPKNENELDQATTVFFSPDISPDQQRMICVRGDHVRRDPKPKVIVETGPRVRKKGRAVLLVETDLSANSRRVIYQSDPNELVDSPVYTHDGEGVAFLSNRDLVILDRDSGEIVQRVRNVLVKGSAPMVSPYPDDWFEPSYLYRSPKPGTFYLVSYVDSRPCIGTVNVRDDSVIWQRRIEAPEELGDEVFGNPELFGGDPHTPGFDSHCGRTYLLWSPCRRYQFYSGSKGMFFWKDFIGCYDHQRGKRFKVVTTKRGFFAI